MGSRRDKKGKNRAHTRRSTRHVLPLERCWWTCFDANGCIDLSAFLTDYKGHWVHLTAWDNDDTGYQRRREYPTRGAAEAAYARAVEEVTRAPNPLPIGWMWAKGLVQA